MHARAAEQPLVHTQPHAQNTQTPQQAVERHWDNMLGRMRELLSSYVWGAGLLVSYVQVGAPRCRHLMQVECSCRTRTLA